MDDRNMLADRSAAAGATVEDGDSEITPPAHSVRDWFKATLTIDTRALAALRIGLALLMLWDLGARSLRFVEYYSDAGACPRAIVMSSRTRPVSVYAISGSTGWAAAMFALHALFARCCCSWDTARGWRWRAAWSCNGRSWPATRCSVIPAITCSCGC
jgi:hypothetical protein